MDFTLDKRLNAKTKKKEYYFGKSADSWEIHSLPVKELTFKLREVYDKSGKQEMDGFAFTVSEPS